MRDDIYLLPIDRTFAEDRVAEIEQLIQDLGPDFNDAFSQSSETWHDNSPFEAVRDKQSMYAAELHQLRTLIHTSTLIPPKKKRGAAGIGDVVSLSSGKRYLLAGDWTHQAGQHTDSIYWVSRHTPIATTLIGKRVGDTVMVAGKTQQIAEVHRG